MALFLAFQFYSIDPHIYFCVNMILFFSLLLCSEAWNQVIWYLYSLLSSGLIFAIQNLLWFHTNFSIFCSIFCLHCNWESIKFMYNFIQDSHLILPIHKYVVSFHLLNSPSPLVTSCSSCCISPLPSELISSNALILLVLLKINIIITNMVIF